jgi:hypothetical protein
MPLANDGDGYGAMWARIHGALAPDDEQRREYLRPFVEADRERNREAKRLAAGRDARRRRVRGGT